MCFLWYIRRACLISAPVTVGEPNLGGENLPVMACGQLALIFIGNTLDAAQTDAVLSGLLLGREQAAVLLFQLTLIGIDHGDGEHAFLIAGTYTQPAAIGWKFGYCPQSIVQ